MSVKIMGRVWDYLLEPSEQAVLLALADHAEHDGSSVRPSVARIAWKTGLHERTVQNVLHDLGEAGRCRRKTCARPHRAVLVLTRKAGHHRPNEYRIVLDRLVRKEAFRPPVMGGDVSPLTPPTEVQSKTVRGANENVRGATANAPKPSYEPSDQPSVARDELRCAMAGCDGRGRGKSGLCVDHLGLRSAVTA